MNLYFISLKALAFFFLSFFSTPFLPPSPATSGLKTVAGKINGNFSVDNSGQANYSIPIIIPPGTNGMQPELSINYNSAGGDGLLGLGWTLNGLSAITRGGCSKLVDGQVTSVAYNANDRFYLDGKELILLPGSAQYGQLNSKYTTNVKSNTTIVVSSVLGPASGPEFFTVYTDDGKKTEYGSTSNSRVIANPNLQTAARVWAITKVTDLNGNYMTFNYIHNNGTIYINQISYTGNMYGLELSRYISFRYTSRTNPIMSYEAGSKLVVNYLLDSIITGVNPKPMAHASAYHIVKSYNLDYRSSLQTGQDQLSSIAEADANGNRLPLTSFGWGAQTAGRQVFPDSPATGVGALTVAHGWKRQNTITTGDINGDGMQDMVGFADNNTSIYLGSPRGFQSPPLLSGIFNVNSGWNDPSAKPIMVADINGDGMADILGFKDTSTYYSLSNGNNMGPITKATDDFSIMAGYQSQGGHPRMLGDINGDGLADIVGFKDNAVYYSLNTGNFSGSVPPFATAVRSVAAFTIGQGYSDQDSFPRQLIDINHDGKMDIAGFGRTGAYYALSNGSGFDATVNILARFRSGAANGFICETLTPRMFGDINGDGYPDIISFNNDSVFYSFNHGNSTLLGPFAFTQPGPAGFTVSTGFPDQRTTPRMLADINGDGRCDIIGFGTNGVSYSLSNGLGFDAISNSTSGFGTAANYRNASLYPRFLADYSGDGFPDIVGCGAATMQYALNLCLPVNQISLLTDLSTSTSISYKPLTDPGVYTPGTRPALPAALVQSPFHVVSGYSYSAQNPSTFNTADFNYTYTLNYGNATSNRTDGFLGFGWKSESDYAKTVTSYFHKGYPITGSIDSIRSLSGNILTREITRYIVTPGAISGKFPYKIKVAGATKYTHCRSGSNWVTTQFDYTRNQYDTSGNLILSASVNAASPQAVRSSDTLYRIFTYWHMTPNQGNTHMYLRATEKHSKSPSSSIRWDPVNDLDLKMMRYFSAGLQLSMAGHWDDVNNTWVTNNYDYDIYGNIISSVNPDGSTTGFEYETTFYTFIQRKTSAPDENGKRLVNSFTFNPDFGVELSETNPAGFPDSTAYDGFGREVAHYGPDPASPSRLIMLDTVILESMPGAPLVVYVKKRCDWTNNDQAQWYWNKSYNDGFGRNYKTESKGPLGQVKVKEKIYHTSIPGQITKEALPRYTSGPGSGSAPAWVNFIYYPDGLLKYQVIDGDSTLTVYDQLNNAIAVTTAAGTNRASTTTSYSNSSGLLVKRIDPNGGVTSYKYLPNRLIDSIIDPNNVVNVTNYNSLGMVTQISNPDNGTSYYTYHNGLLVNKKKLLRNGLRASCESYTYDQLGRLLTRTQYMANDSAGARDKFFYDGTYTMGMLDSVVRTISAQATGTAAGQAAHLYGPSTPFAYKYGYDCYGRLNMTKAYLPAPLRYWNNIGCTVSQAADAPAAACYTTLLCYNAKGDLTKETLPDGSVQSYTYLGNGSVKAINLKDNNLDSANALTMVQYDQVNPFGQAAAIRFRNGMNSQYTYDSSYGIMSSHLLTSSISNDTVVSNGYHWSATMHLDSIIDRRSRSAGRLNESEYYTYNNMGWLTGAASPVYNTISYSYNKGGDMMTRNNEVYRLGQGHRLAASTLAIRDTTFAATYDEAGNMRTSSSTHMQLQSTTLALRFISQVTVPGAHILPISPGKPSIMKTGAATKAVPAKKPGTGSTYTCNNYYSLVIPAGNTLTGKGFTNGTSTCLDPGKQFSFIINVPAGGTTLVFTKQANLKDCDTSKLGVWTSDPSSSAPKLVLWARNRKPAAGSLTLNPGTYTLTIGMIAPAEAPGRNATCNVQYQYTETNLMRPQGTNRYTFSSADLLQAISRSYTDPATGSSASEYLNLYYDHTGNKLAQTDAYIMAGASALSVQSKANLYISDHSSIVCNIAGGINGPVASYTFNKSIKGPGGKMAMVKTPWNLVSLMVFDQAHYTGYDSTVSTSDMPGTAFTPGAANDSFHFPQDLRSVKISIILFFLLALAGWLMHMGYQQLRSGIKGLYRKPAWLSYTYPFASVPVFLYIMFGSLLTAHESHAQAPVPAAPGVQVFYFHHNHISSLSAVTDSGGRVIERLHYDPYGRSLDNNTAAVPVSASFTGKAAETGVGLYNYGPRMYNAYTGRFISADSEIGKQHGNSPLAFNRYAYAGDNPIEYTDPSGHWAWLISGLVGAIVSVVAVLIVKAILHEKVTGLDIGLAALSGFITGATGVAIGAGVGRVASFLGSRTLGRATATIGERITKFAADRAAGMALGETGEAFVANLPSSIMKTVISPFFENTGGNAIAGAVETGIKMALHDKDAGFSGMAKETFYSAALATAGGIIGKGAKSALGYFARKGTLFETRFTKTFAANVKTRVDNRSAELTALERSVGPVVFSRDAVRLAWYKAWPEIPFEFVSSKTENAIKIAFDSLNPKQEEESTDTDVAGGGGN
ncbi:MAG: FG-GAP-like repeat-containing protein [Bacteroidota bacterium]